MLFVDEFCGILVYIKFGADVTSQYENMPVKDMAKVLGITVDAVKQRLFRARKMLREILESEAVL